MKYYYSPSTNGFYNTVNHGPRKIAAEQTAAERKAGKRPAMVPNPACQIPGDATEITAERMDELFAAQAGGRFIADMGGKPVAITNPGGSAGAAAARRVARDRKLADSDWTQLPDAPLSADERAAWATWRQLLRDLDMDGSDWPDQPGSEAA